VTDPLLVEEIRGRNQKLQTLGNLTLLTPASNQSAGHASFEDKKSRLINSLTSMNAKLAQLSKWDEVDITKRSIELADLAASVWPYPVQTT
jgi:hypothetical protein